MSKREDIQGLMRPIIGFGGDTPFERFEVYGVAEFDTTDPHLVSVFTEAILDGDGTFKPRLHLLAPISAYRGDFHHNTGRVRVTQTLIELTTDMPSNWVKAFCDAGIPFDTPADRSCLPDEADVDSIFVPCRIKGSVTVVGNTPLFFLDETPNDDYEFDESLAESILATMHPELEPLANLYSSVYNEYERMMAEQQAQVEHDVEPDYGVEADGHSVDGDEREIFGIDLTEYTDSDQLVADDGFADYLASAVGNEAPVGFLDVSAQPTPPPSFDALLGNLPDESASVGEPVGPDVASLFAVPGSGSDEQPTDDKGVTSFGEIVGGVADDDIVEFPDDAGSYAPSDSGIPAGVLQAMADAAWRRESGIEDDGSDDDEYDIPQ